MFCYYVLYVVFKNLPNNFYTISVYYQTVNFLNTKNNLILLLLMLLITLKNVRKQNNNYINIFIGVSLFFYTSIQLEVVKLPFSVLINTSTLNVNLLNGIMLIHPIILYYMYVVYILEYKVNLDNKINNKKKIVKFVNLSKLFLCTCIVLVAILLGGWWAEQELSWGGWWSWDFVELLSINYLLYLLVILHSKKHTLTSHSKTYSISTPLILFFTAVLSVRYNIINSIHNFISVESQNQYYYYIIVVLALLIYLYIYILLFKNFFLLSFSIKKIFLSLLLVFFICFLLNLKFLFGDFNLQINFLKNIKMLYMYIIILYIILLQVNQNASMYILLLILYKNIFTFFDFLLISVVLYNLKKSKNIFKTTDVKNLHNMLLMSLLASTHQIYNFLAPNQNPIVTCVSGEWISNFKLKNLYGCFVNPDRKNTLEGFSGSLKSVFEKSVFAYENTTFVELYSYNYQSLIQLYGCVVFFTLACTLMTSIRLWIYKTDSNSLTI